MGRRHPLSIPRVSTTIDLAPAPGWLPDQVYIDSPGATAAELARFHDSAYLEVLCRAESEGRVSAEEAAHHNLERLENPIHGPMFHRPATACGGTLEAVELLMDGGIVHHPAGGTRHGRRDRADDPLSRLELSNGALFGVVEALMGLSHRLLVLRGGATIPGRRRTAGPAWGRPSTACPCPRSCRPPPRRCWKR